MSADWTAGQLLRMTDGRQGMRLEQPRYNPRPAGVIRKGSTTDLVLCVLRAHPKRFFTCGELMARTKGTHAAVSWALLYLRELGHVQTATDQRQGNYLRYRFFEKE
jgi:hypothetical protein